ncbi:MAG: FAD-dependent oxidoreductase, partial [Pseudomonadota bacterium]
MSDVIIVGAGLAGAAAAIVLARGERSVTLLEKTIGPKPKVCGEFLSRSALDTLATLNISASGPSGLGGVPLSHFRLSAGDAATRMPLGFEAVSLSRQVLDEEMLQHAADAGATVVRGAAVTGIVRSGDGYLVDAGSQHSASHLFVASGKSEVRNMRRGPGLHDNMVGLKRYARLPPGRTPDPTIDIVLFPGGYCGIQPVEGQRLNVCLAVAARALKEVGGPGLVFELVRRASQEAATLLTDTTWDGPSLAVGRVPYGFIRTRTDGPFFLGDQAAVIPSFCGEGMGLALRSGVMAAEAHLAGKSAAAYQREFA